MGLPGDARAAQGNISTQKGMWVLVESVDAAMMVVTHAHALLG